MRYGYKSKMEDIGIYEQDDLESSASCAIASFFQRIKKDSTKSRKFIYYKETEIKKQKD